MLDKFFDDKKELIDNLTQIFMRDVIVEYIEKLIKEKTEFTFGILDIDNFKNINDENGHLVGDLVLKEVAKSLLGVVKNRGVVGRYGGDEFIFVFPKISEYDDVWHVGFDLLKSAAKITFDDYDNISLSYTLGMSRFPLNGNNIDELFEVADKALYRGKMKGRNCFIIYLPEKHANIDLKSKRDTINSPIYIHSKIYEFLHNGNDLEKSIQNAINYLGSYLMIDHLCIETKNKLLFEYVHPISKRKDGFLKIGYTQIRNMMSNIGIIYENTVLESKLVKTNELFMILERQSIYSVVLAEIRVNSNIYGYLRCDMVSMDTGRIWQQEDLVTIQLTAMLIGLIMEAKGD